MSFLSILLFISAFYFAHGRPDAAVTAASVGQTAADSSSESLPDDSISTEQDGQYQDELNGFIQAMSLAIDSFMLPIMSDLTEDKQDLVKTTAMNGFSGFFNYIILMYNNEDKSIHFTNGGQNFPLDGKDIMLEFDEMEPLDEEVTAPEIETTAKTQVGPEVDATPGSETNPESNT